MNDEYNFLAVVSNHGMGTSYFCDQIRNSATTNLVNIINFNTNLIIH